MQGIAPDVFESQKPVARKQYECCECSTKIQAGQRYQRVKGLWDGDWQTFTICLRCSELWGELEPYDGKVFGKLSELVEMHSASEIAEDHYLIAFKVRQWGALSTDTQRAMLEGKAITRPDECTTDEIQGLAFAVRKLRYALQDSIGAIGTIANADEEE